MFVLRRHTRVAFSLGVALTALLLAVFAPASSAATRPSVTLGNDANQDGVFTSTENVAKTATYPDTVTFQISLNTGSLTPTVTFVSLTDTAGANLSGCNPLLNTPEPANTTLTCTYTLAINAPQTTPISDTVNMVFNAGGLDRSSSTSTVNTPAMSLAKSSTTTLITTAGQVVPYTYLISNTGSVALTGITLSDNNTDSSPSCGATTLGVGDSMTCTGQHTVTQAELSAGGNLVNTATATSNEAPNQTATDSIPILAPPPPCPTGTKVNFRWHYSANGSSGSWSGTKTALCPSGLSMGPQAMEGDLKVAPGTTLKAGYDFTVPGNNSTFPVTVSNPQVVFAVACASGAVPSASTLTVTMPSQTYTVSGSAWFPSGNQSSPLVYQGAVTVPDLCAGGLVRLNHGGTFTASVG